MRNRDLLILIIGFILLFVGIWWSFRPNIIEGLIDTTNIVMVGVAMVGASDSTGNLYYANTGLATAPNWLHLSGTFKQVSGSIGDIVAIAADNSIQFGKQQIKTDNSIQYGWTNIPGRLTQVSFDYPMLVGLNTEGHIMYTDNIEFASSTLPLALATKTTGPPSFTYIAINAGRGYGVGSDTNIYFSYDIRDPVWVNVTTNFYNIGPPGKTITQLSFNSETVAIIDSYGSIYYSNTLIESAPVWKTVPKASTLFARSISLKTVMCVVSDGANLYATGDITNANLTWGVLTLPSGIAMKQAELIYYDFHNRITSRPAVFVKCSNPTDTAINNKCYGGCPTGYHLDISIPNNTMCKGNPINRTTRAATLVPPPYYDTCPSGSDPIVGVNGTGATVSAACVSNVGNPSISVPSGGCPFGYSLLSPTACYARCPTGFTRTGTTCVADIVTRLNTASFPLYLCPTGSGSGSGSSAFLCYYCPVNTNFTSATICTGNSFIYATSRVCPDGSSIIACNKTICPSNSTKNSNGECITSYGGFTFVVAPTNVTIPLNTGFGYCATAYTTICKYTDMTPTQTPAINNPWCDQRSSTPTIIGSLCYGACVAPKTILASDPTKCKAPDQPVVITVPNLITSPLKFCDSTEDQGTTTTNLCYTKCASNQIATATTCATAPILRSINLSSSMIYEPCLKNEVYDNGLCKSACPTGTYANGDLCQRDMVVVGAPSTIKCKSSPFGSSKKWLCDTDADLAALVKDTPEGNTYVLPTDQVCVADDPTTKMYYCQSGTDAKDPYSGTRSKMQQDYDSTCQNILKNYLDISNNITSLILIQTGVNDGLVEIQSAKIAITNIYGHIGCDATIASYNNSIVTWADDKRRAEIAVTQAQSVVTRVQAVLAAAQKYRDEKESAKRAVEERGMYGWIDATAAAAAAEAALTRANAELDAANAELDAANAEFTRANVPRPVPPQAYKLCLIIQNSINDLGSEYSDLNTTIGDALAPIQTLIGMRDGLHGSIGNFQCLP